MEINFGFVMMVSIGCFIIGLALLCVLLGYIPGRFGGQIKKESHPLIFWFGIIIFLALGLFSIILGLTL